MQRGRVRDKAAALSRDRELTSGAAAQCGMVLTAAHSIAIDVRMEEHKAGQRALLIH